MGPMTERDWRRSLRGAVYRADGMAVVAIVRTGGIRDDVLQLMGEGLLVAIIGRVEACSRPRCRLRRRAPRTRLVRRR